MTNKARCSEQSKCLEMLYLIVDGQATDDQIRHFQQHMNECGPCYKNHQLEQAIKQTVQSKLDKKEVPAGLIESIKNKIREAV